MSNTTEKIKTPPNPWKSSGMPAAISQGTAATDNLSALIKNTVLLFPSRLVMQPPPIILNKGKESL